MANRLNKQCTKSGSSWCADFECDECPISDHDLPKPAKTLSEAVSALNREQAEAFCQDIQETLTMA